MQTIIKYLLTVISYQYNIIISLFILSFGKKFDFLPNPKADKPIDKKYRKLNIDSLPLLKVNDKLDFNSILQKYLVDNGKPLKTIKHKPRPAPGSPSGGRYSSPGAPPAAPGVGGWGNRAGRARRPTGKAPRRPGTSGAPGPSARRRPA